MTNKTTQTEKNIRNYYKEDLKSSKRFIDEFENVESLLNNWRAKELLTAKQYEQAKSMKLKEIKKIIIEKLEKNNAKKLEKQLKKMQAIYNAEPVKHGKIEADWVHNRTWGNCPRGSYANCFEYVEHKSVTGCGYDKLSTLTGDFLTEDLHMLRVVCDFIDKKKINKDNIREILGYGIRISSGLPYFEGGVGASCHVSILKKLGFDAQWHETKKSDLFIFDKITK